MFIGGSWSKCWLTSRELRLFCGCIRKDTVDVSYDTWPIINRPVSIVRGTIPIDCSWSRRFPIHPRINFAKSCSNPANFGSFLFPAFFLRALSPSTLPLHVNIFPYHTLYIDLFSHFFSFFPAGSNEQGSSCLKIHSYHSECFIT